MLFGPTPVAAGSRLIVNKPTLPLRSTYELGEPWKAESETASPYGSRLPSSAVVTPGIAGRPSPKCTVCVIGSQVGRPLLIQSVTVSRGVSVFGRLLKFR